MTRSTTFLNNWRMEKIINEMKKKWHADATLLHHTGSIYGLGCSAFSPAAIERINSLKNRPDGKGYQVLLAHHAWLDELAHLPSPAITRLCVQYSPANVSFILPIKDKRLAAVAMDDTVAFRVPTSPSLRLLINDVIKAPLVSTSINVAGDVPCTDLKIIQKKYDSWFDLGLLADETVKTVAVSTIIAFDDDDEPICIRSGSVDFAEIKLSYEQPLILFTCTGNTCRSPIAEYLAKSIIAKQNLPLRAASAGQLDRRDKIAPNSSLLLAERAIDASKHRSQKITADLLQSAWKVVTMEQHHTDKIIKEFPDASDKVFTLAAMTSLTADISDPYRQGIDEYEKAFQLIEKGVISLLEQLKTCD